MAKNILNLEMIDREVQYFDDPFRHAVIDNFFSEEDLVFVTNKLDKIQEDKDTNGFKFDPLRVRKRRLVKDLHNYQINPDERFAKYFQFVDTLDIKQDKEKIYTSEYTYSFRVKGVDRGFPVHTENIHKGVSLLVYLSEEENYGTLLYDEEKQFKKSIGWKNNRAFVMSGFYNQEGKLPGNSTWHTYKTKPGTLRRTFFGHTTVTKESLLAHSLYKGYYEKGEKGNTFFYGSQWNNKQ